MFTYRDFVTELRPLLEASANLRSLDDLHENPKFRRWRHELTDLIDRIEALGYSISCSIKTRIFDKLGHFRNPPTLPDRITAYNRDIDDTVIELTTIVSRFDKYGNPQVSSESIQSKEPETHNSPKPLQMPQQMTAGWLWQNAPVSLWWKVALALAAVFAAGVGIGQSSGYKELMEKLKPIESQVQKGK